MFTLPLSVSFFFSCFKHNFDEARRNLFEHPTSQGPSISSPTDRRITKKSLILYSLSSILYSPWWNWKLSSQLKCDSVKASREEADWGLRTEIVFLWAVLSRHIIELQLRRAPLDTSASESLLRTKERQRSRGPGKEWVNNCFGNQHQHLLRTKSNFQDIGNYLN